MSQTPDTEPGDYFVSVIDAGRCALLLGPFAKHQEALDEVDRVHAHAEKVDPWSHFYAFGTCRLALNSGKTGKFNEVLKTEKSS